MSNSKRILYLDIFRFLMVTVALLSHVLGQFYVWDTLNPTARLYIRFFSRGATPGLLILFGFMIELVYVRHAKQKGFAFSVQRMTYRAILCYLAFILIALVGFLGNTDLTGLLRNFLLVSPALNANIFAIYLFVLFTIMPVIALRLRFGVNALLGIVGAVWLIDFFILKSLANPFLGASESLAYLIGFLTGVGDTWGPSIFHSLTVTLFGMVLGNAFTNRSRVSILRLTLFAGLASFIAGLEILNIGWIMFLDNIATYTAYRAHNSVVYYAYGVVFSLLLMVMAWGLNRVLSNSVRGPITYLGSRTFLYFLIGNMILTAFPRSLSINLPTALLAFLLLTGATYLLIKLWEAKFHSWAPIVKTRTLMLKTSSQLAKVLTGARGQAGLAPSGD